MKELIEFVKLSKFAGERFDLIQAGGGNTSVKLNNSIMLIKASGFMLSEVELDKGYLKVEYRKIEKILKNKRIFSLKDKGTRSQLAIRLLGKTAVEKSNNPSIETFLHALLYKYTLHVHPLVVNAITCKKNYREILNNIFTSNAVSVNYMTPGLELALGLRKAIKEYQDKHGYKPKVIFLGNHGLIVSSDNPAEIKEILEETLNKLEKYLKVDLKCYKLTNRISALVNSIKNSYDISYISGDSELNKLLKAEKTLFFKPPFCPDILVYCGMAPLGIKSLKDKRPFINYHKKYAQNPRVVIYKNHIFFVARNLNKARAIEDVFKFGVLTLKLAKNRINFLSKAELLYLGNWKAEKYRQCR
ncbi:MAG: class II aldolase [Candidatus Omnitrophica bacterium]|nr:class II aldolase [Candidatus Omnitrophota bacterium]